MTLQRVMIHHRSFEVRKSVTFMSLAKIVSPFCCAAMIDASPLLYSDLTCHAALTHAWVKDRDRVSLEEAVLTFRSRLSLKPTISKFW
jgi:hypothetical protein